MKKENMLYFIIMLLLGINIYLFYRIENLEKRYMLAIESISTRRGVGIGDEYEKKAVKNRILRGYKDIKDCYEEYLSRKPKRKEGKIKLDWEITEDGDVENLGIVYDELGDKELERCIIEKISKWKFPRPFYRRYVYHVFRFNYKDK